MLRMVVGFLFDPGFFRVALIRKNKPDWQKGKANGIGGKIEAGETPLVAMAREFEEEAGLTCLDWQQYLRLDSGTNRWELNVFYAVGPLHEVRTMEEEPVFIAAVPDVLYGRHTTVGNIPWLVAMARAVGTGAERCVFFDTCETRLRS